MCLPTEPIDFENLDWDGKKNRALIQGAGIDETGEIAGQNGNLLEAEVKPISNDECKIWMRNTRSRQFQMALSTSLPNGLPDNILCALPVSNGYVLTVIKFTLQSSEYSCSEIRFFP